MDKIHMKLLNHRISFFFHHKKKQQTKENIRELQNYICSVGICRNIVESVRLLCITYYVLEHIFFEMDFHFA